MFNFSKVVLLGLGLGISTLSFSYSDDMNKALKLFEARDSGNDDHVKFDTTLQAYDAFEKIYASTGDTFAFVQMGRLALWGGGLLDGASMEKRQTILRRCYETSEQAIKQEKQEYYYFYLGCMGGLGKITGDIFERGKLAGKLKRVTPSALKSRETKPAFEADGIARILAGVYSSHKAKLLFLYDPKQAVSFSQAALDTPATVYPPFPDALSGTDFYENYYYHLISLLAQSVKDEDINLFKQAVTEFASTIATIHELKDADALPQGRGPETLRYLKLMEKLQSRILACGAKNGNGWISCTEDELKKD